MGGSCLLEAGFFQGQPQMIFINSVGLALRSLHICTFHCMVACVKAAHLCRIGCRHTAMEQVLDQHLLFFIAVYYYGVVSALWCAAVWVHQHLLYCALGRPK